MTTSLAVRAARAFGFRGELIDLHLPQGRVTVAARLDQATHNRRLETGAPPILDRDVVTALWELPEGVEIQENALPGWVVDRIDDAGGGVLRVQSRYVRTMRPAVAITGAIALGRSPSQLLARVGQLSAVATMGIVSQGRVKAHDPGVLNASLYGIGVAQARQGNVEVVLAPEPVSPTPGPFLWWISELAYEALIDKLSPAGPRP